MSVCLGSGQRSPSLSIRTNQHGSTSVLLPTNNLFTPIKRFNNLHESGQLIFHQWWPSLWFWKVKFNDTRTCFVLLFHCTSAVNTAVVPSMMRLQPDTRLQVGNTVTLFHCNCYAGVLNKGSTFMNPTFSHASLFRKLSSSHDALEEPCTGPSVIYVSQQRTR